MGERSVYETVFSLRIVMGTYVININGDKMNGNNLIEIVCIDDNKFIYTIK